jgi:hypothetical protein
MADRRKFDKRVRQIVHQIALFERWLHRCDGIEMPNEDLIENADPLLVCLRDFPALETQFANNPGLLKTTPPLEEGSLNRSEISDVLDLDWRDAYDWLIRLRSASPDEKGTGGSRARRSPAPP